MNERVKIAVDSFRNGYNCAQSVLVAFSDLTGFKSEDLLAMGSALGGGFCRTRNLCGAVNAVGILYGLITKTDDKEKEIEWKKTKVYLMYILKQIEWTMEKMAMNLSI